MEFRKERYDHLLKILMIGDAPDGKSSLMKKFTEDSFSENMFATVGVDFKIRCLDIDGQRVKLQIWDTAGQERFGGITSTYYRGSHGVIVVFDVTKGNTFANIEK